MGDPEQPRDVRVDLSGRSQSIQAQLRHVERVRARIERLVLSGDPGQPSHVLPCRGRDKGGDGRERVGGETPDAVGLDVIAHGPKHAGLLRGRRDVAPLVPRIQGVLVGDQRPVVGPLAEFAVQRVGQELPQPLLQGLAVAARLRPVQEAGGSVRSKGRFSLVSRPPCNRKDLSTAHSAEKLNAAEGGPVCASRINDARIQTERVWIRLGLYQHGRDAILRQRRRLRCTARSRTTPIHQDRRYMGSPIE